MILPKITIVTPSLNQNDFIEQTINSVLDQSYPNLEYIVIDGGSSDGSLDTIKKYSKHLTYWISESDTGQANAINKGIKKASGELFNWLNSDDILEPEALNKVAHLYNDQDSPHVICGNCRVFDSESGQSREVYRMKLGKDPCDSILNRHINQPSTFYKLNIVRELGCLNESLNYVFDAELWFKYLARYGQDNVELMDDVLSRFRWHAASKTGANDFLPFYDEEKNIHFHLAKFLGIPDFLTQEIFETICDFKYSSKDWDLQYLSEQEFRLYFNLRHYKSLYYKQKYSESRQCMNELANSKERPDNKLFLTTKTFTPRTINLLRSLSAGHHHYLKHDLKHQVNLYFRFRSKLNHIAPTRTGIDRSIPVIINNRNRLSFLKQLISWLELHGFSNLNIIDNNSGYPPLLEYYRKTGHTVFHLDKNAGHRALWNSHIFDRFKKQYYIYTDPDILPGEHCPDDFLTFFANILKKYPSVQKVGFGLKTDDLPDHFHDKKKVIEWEGEFWKNALEPNVFEAKIDTTFALYRPFVKGGHEISSLRTGGDYVARHLPWYLDSSNLPMEEKYYISHSDKSSSWYHRNEQYGPE